MSTPFTAVVTVRASDMQLINAVNGVYQITINIPEARRFQNFELAVKEFNVIRNYPLITTADNQLNLSTNIQYTNHYDSRYGINNSNNSLVSVPYFSPSMNGPLHFIPLTASPFNTQLQFWLMNDEGGFFTNYIDFELTFVVNAK